MKDKLIYDLPNEPVGCGAFDEEETNQLTDKERADILIEVLTNNGLIDN
jgi:hypothetical protein